MKKITLVIVAVIIGGSAFAQKRKKETNDNKPDEVIVCSEFHITKPLSELFANYNENENKSKRTKEEDDRENRKPQHFVKGVKDGGIYANDEASMQKEMGNIPGKSPLTNWAGQTGSGIPPDPTGAVGPNNYVQMVNATTFKVYNKVTGAVTLTGTLGNLWSPATTNAGDPIVLYDKAADRWFLAQFGSPTSSTHYIYIAISTTGNPAGTYYTYTFTSPSFPDYLKFSVWQGGYYMTSNQAQKVFAFDRTAMLAGSASARSIYKTFSPPNAGYFFVPLTGDASDGVLPPANTPCPIFSYSDNGWGGSYVDAINIYQMDVNWVPATPTASITLAANLPTTAFDGSYSSSWDDCPQPGTTQKLDGIGGTLMFRAQWKPWNSAGYNSVVLNWAVKISSTQRSIKWCELRQNQTTNVWSIYQQGTYTPDGNTRWLGSIAMNDNGSIALCYLKSGSAAPNYPSLCYAGRRPCDPLGTLPITEVIAKAGTGSQTGGINRVGDYSETVLDPSDGITFWHTGEYMGTTGSSAQRTQIYSFQLPLCVTAPPTANFAAATTVCTGTQVTFNDSSTNVPTSWQWTFPGGTPASSTFQNPTVVYNTAGTYNVKLKVINSLGADSVTFINYIHVNQTPTVTVNSTSTCYGQSVTLVAGGATSYTWSAGATAIAGTDSATATPTSSNVYIVTGTSNGCSDTAHAGVIVYLKPTVTNTSLSQNICTGATANFTPTSGVAGTTFSWTASASSGTITGFSASGTGPISNVLTNSGATAGNVTYVITPTGPAPLHCVGNSVSLIVHVFVVPPTPTITQSVSILTSSSATGNQWYLNGVIIPGATSQTYNFTQNGTYTVVVSNAGCSSAPSNALVENFAGIDEAGNAYLFDVYPNPSDGNFVVSFSALSKSDFNITLYDVLGQVIYKDVLKDYNGTYSKKLNLSQYAKGIYFVKLSNDKFQTVKKLMIE